MAYTVYDTLAVVIGGWQQKDASRRLLVYSKDIGRILVQAQAVRKLESKLAPAVQTYAESRLELVYGQAGWRLVGAHPKQNFYLSSSAGRPAVARISGLLARLVPAQRPDRNLYKIAVGGLTALQSASKSGYADTVETLLAFRLVSHLGYAPDPSAQSLARFADSNLYTSKHLSAFKNQKGRAVRQINQALETAQL
jgi:recombinational DNA repair protein (RecF pathway)